MRRAVFLDRDDTLIHCRSVTTDGDLGDPALVSLKHGALDACRTLADAGYQLVVVSNQGGVARGRYTTADVDRVNQKIYELLDGLINAFRFCPYHPGGSVPEFTREHPWRKPQPGMLLDAAEQMGLDLASSWMIGDAVRDCEAGRGAGCSTILISPDPDPSSPAVDHVAPDLPAAADIIVHPARYRHG